MGSCLNKSNNVINIRINEYSGIRNEKIHSHSKKYLSTAISSIDLNYNKNNEKKQLPYPSLYFNNISKIIILPEKNNEDINKINSLREILELLEY